MKKVTYKIIDEFSKNDKLTTKDIKKIFNEKLLKVILSIELNTY